MITIREFQTGDEAAFRRLNEEWISRYFVMEPKDEASFADPRKNHSGWWWQNLSGDR